jgi:uncharacterized protein (DUF952 family)
VIFHIVKRDEWTDALRRGIYAPGSLRAEGIIHCSTIAQIVDTANRFFRGQDDLVVLCIDERRLKAALKYEPPAMTADNRPNVLFPHLHGPLNLDAVTQIIEFPCDRDGSFRLPEGLRQIVRQGQQD